MENKMKIITLETLPVINFSGLSKLGAEIDAKIESLNIDGQIATVETVKALKSMKSDLNKDYKALETERIALDKAIKKPYSTFLVEYTKCVKDKYNDAIPKLTTKILSVESKVKAKKEEQLKEFFNEYCASKKIDFVSFENVGLNITLSATDKSFKNSITTFVDSCSDNINLINALANTQDYINDVTVEYKTTLNLSASMSAVKIRHEKKAELENKQIDLPLPDIEPIKSIIETSLSAPVVEEKKVEAETFTANFSVTATKEDLKALKSFMTDKNIQFKSI